MNRTLVVSLIGLCGFTALVSAADKKDDPFAMGSVWTGEFLVAGKGNTPLKWALTVSERKGLSVKGEIVTFNREKKLETTKFTGTATNQSSGGVSLITEQKGFGQAALKGKLKDNELTLIFYGRTKLGQTGAGTATLKRIN